MLRQSQHELVISTAGRGLYEVTAQVRALVARSGLDTGLAVLHLQHTSASLLIQENADPDVQSDLVRFFERIAPENARDYIHTLEGPDDMPAHIRAALTNSQLSIPLIQGHLALGAWQGVYLFEHRSLPHRRAVAAHLFGE